MANGSQAFNPADYDLNDVQSAGQPAAQASAASGFDPSQYDTSDIAPSYADGTTPESAVNKSPVDVADRFKFAFGNKEGVLKDLKSKFEDVKTDTRGNLVVKQAGLWHRVDPKGLGDTDPWDTSEHIVGNMARTGKELLADIADNAARSVSGAAQGAIMGGSAGAVIGGVGAIPGAIGGGIIGAVAPFISDAVEEKVQEMIANNPKKALAGGVGLAAMGIAKNAGAILNKGNVGALIASGAIEGARSSLGRMIGTYDGDAEEQLKDAGLEMAFNLGGMTIAAGVKPSAELVGNAVRATGEMLAKAPGASRDVIAHAQAMLTKTSPEAIYRLSERPANIQAEINVAKNAVGNTTDKVIQQLDTKNIDLSKKFINSLQPALNSKYVQLSKEAVQSVDSNFTGSVKEAVDDSFTQLKNMGVGDFTGSASKFELHDNKALGQQVQSFLDAGEADKAKLVQQLIGNPKAQGIIQSAVDALDAQASSVPGKDKGATAALKLLTFKRSVNGLLNDLEDEAVNSNAATAKQLISVIDQSLDNHLLKKFEPAAINGIKKPNPYELLNSTYSEIKQQIQPLLNVQKQAIRQGTDEAYGGALDRILNSSTKYRAAGNSTLFDKAVSSLDPSNNIGLSRIRDRIIDIDTAKQFMPKFRPGYMSGAMLGAGGAAAMMNPGLLPAVAGGAAITSPALNRVAITAGAGVANKVAPVSAATKTAVEVMFKGKEYLSKLAMTGKTKDFLGNPQVVQQFYQSLFTAPQMQQQLTDSLMGHALDVSNPSAPVPMQDPKGGK